MIGRFVFGKHGGVNILLLPANLPNVLARVIDSDSDSDNKCCALNSLLNLAAKSPSFVLAGNEALACALCVVQQQGTGGQRVSFCPPIVLFPSSHHKAVTFYILI